MVFSKVLDLSSNASGFSSRCSKLGSWDFVCFFVSLPEHSHSQSIKPVVHWTSSVERLHGSKNRAQPLVFAGSRKSIKEEKIKFPRKSWATPRSQACSQSITKQSICRPGAENNADICFPSVMQPAKWSMVVFLWLLQTAELVQSRLFFAGIAPIANVVCARPSTEVECVFAHFPVSSNFCEKCSAIQTFALALCSPWRQEWVTSMVFGWKESNCQNLEGPSQNCKNCLHCFLLGHKLLVDHLSKATWW